MPVAKCCRAPPPHSSLPDGPRTAGDIGTSPLYAYSSVFYSQPSQEDVLAAGSLFFWWVGGWVGGALL